MNQPGTYQDRLEDSNIDHDGVISAMEATNLVLEYNVVSGGERVCFHVAPQSCEAVSGLYTGNIARTCCCFHGRNDSIVVDVAVFKSVLISTRK
jgi:hypothetical protein